MFEKQRECKSCFEVKPLRKFFDKEYGSPFGTIFEPTWLCQKCADGIGYEAMEKAADKYYPKFK